MSNTSLDMIEHLTLHVDLNSLPPSTLEKMRRAALKRGVGIGVVAKELLINSSERINGSAEDGTAVEERELAVAH